MTCKTCKDLRIDKQHKNDEIDKLKAQLEKKEEEDEEWDNHIIKQNKEIKELKADNKELIEDRQLDPLNPLWQQIAELKAENASQLEEINSLRRKNAEQWNELHEDIYRLKAMIKTIEKKK